MSEWGHILSQLGMLPKGHQFDLANATLGKRRCCSDAAALVPGRQSLPITAQFCAAIHRSFQHGRQSCSSSCGRQHPMNAAQIVSRNAYSMLLLFESLTKCPGVTSSTWKASKYSAAFNVPRFPGQPSIGVGISVECHHVPFRPYQRVSRVSACRRSCVVHV
ncbi:unnamed protein product [Ectocarpus sp. 13 AM-2016]